MNDVERVRLTGSPIVTESIRLHALASVNVKVYVPAHNPIAVDVVCDGTVFHEYVYAPDPPLEDAAADPSHAPLHIASIPIIDVFNGRGSVISTLSVEVQPTPSVVITV